MHIAPPALKGMRRVWHRLLQLDSRCKAAFPPLRARSAICAPILGMRKRLAVTSPARCASELRTRRIPRRSDRALGSPPPRPTLLPRQHPVGWRRPLYPISCRSASLPVAPRSSKSVQGALGRDTWLRGASPAGSRACTFCTRIAIGPSANLAASAPPSSAHGTDRHALLL